LPIGHGKSHYTRKYRDRQILHDVDVVIRDYFREKPDEKPEYVRAKNGKDFKT